MVPDPDNNPTNFLYRFPGFGMPDDTWPLWWYQGEIRTKCPPPRAIAPLLAKLGQIALALGARVCGDDNETYDVTSEETTEPKPPNPLPRF
ncbi:MAG TPA: hypothetical protein DCQ32_10975 [Cyanobacteria bacterium UBA8156]|nr:hypothetical protein [Cyanobacteria bacterium UBA8156]